MGRSEKKERVKKRKSLKREKEFEKHQEIKRKSLVKDKIKESLINMPTANAPRDTTGIPEHRRTGKIRLKISKHAKKDDKGLLRKISELGRLEAERESVKVKKNDSQILPILHRPGWMIQRTTLLNVDMPISPKYSTLTKNFGFLPKLRKVVQDKQKSSMESNAS